VREDERNAVVSIPRCPIKGGRIPVMGAYSLRNPCFSMR
jgi:hypothetical protein